MALLSAAKIPYQWQYPIYRFEEEAAPDGNFKKYIADFVIFPIAKITLLIEVDGDAHTGEEDYDMKRDAYLAKRGYKVLRFTNRMVLHHGADVIRAIQTELLKMKQGTVTEARID